VRSGRLKLYDGFLKNNPPVTNEDRIAMGLPVYNSDSKHPSPVPNTAPGSDADTSISRRVKLVFYDDAGAHKKAKPADVHCVECKWNVFDTRE
jgi:hypothetical protein